MRGTLALLAALVACAESDPIAPLPAAAERPWSVQLHVHGPFSEGPGSLESHAREASAVGLDVLWWSDHDFRITSYRHATSFGFEGPNEPLERGEAWSARSTQEARGRKQIRPLARRCSGESGGEFAAGGAAEGERSLRLSARSRASEPAGCFYALAADRALATRPLASGVALEVQLFAESLGEDARAVVELELSEHGPARAEGYAPLVLRYELGLEAGAPARSGSLQVVPIAVEAGHWVRVRLPVSRDAERGFPEVAPGDNSLHQIRVGVESPRGTPAAARFDALRIEQEIAGPAGFDAQRALIERVAPGFPALVQLQGVELSYELRHLNVFGSEPLRLDYDALFAEREPLAGPPAPADRAALRGWATTRAVEIAHARGDLVSYNHMFGVGFEGAEPRRSREELVEMLAQSRIFGADLLEVGYRDRGGHGLEDHLGVWDDLARRGLRPVGVGVSDSHGGRWSDDANDLVSWVLAPTPERAALLAGLRRGRVFFGDLTRFDGSLDLETAAGAVMGEIAVTGEASQEVRIAATGLAAGDLVDVVVSGEASARHVAEGAALRVVHRVEIPPAQDAFVRVEVRDENGAPKAFSNPIHFVRPERAAGLPEARVFRGARDPR